MAFPDVFTKRELRGLHLHCFNSGCPWHGIYEELEVSSGSLKGKDRRGAITIISDDFGSTGERQ